jgi:AcrR family transcriptional regulator
VTLEAVAAAAGVSKGALLHHFPTKQSLLDETVANLLKRVDAEIDALLASDSIPYGRFTRAYVQAAFGGVTSGLDAVTSKLLMAVITGPSPSAPLEPMARR